MNKMRRSVLVGMVVSALAIVTSSQAVFADPRDFILKNNSYSTVLSVYVSPASSNDWGNDVLGWDLLYSGWQMPITFQRWGWGSTCYFDIKVVTTSWQPVYFWDVDLCSTGTLTVR